MFTDKSIFPFLHELIEAKRNNNKMDFDKFMKHDFFAIDNICM
tara:strand:+ start:520 stop:648 length:129 start_codon:yes stop_codon:yes gene_type:complete